MSTFDFNAISTALDDPGKITSGVDFSGKSLKLDTAKDAQPIIEAINSCPHLQYLTLTGNTLGVAAAQAIAQALANRPELKEARFSDMFTGRMKTEIPPALSALGEGMITGGARLSVLDLSDNAFGPIGVEGLAKLLQSDVCSQLQELRLNNNGLGTAGGRLLARALGGGAGARRLRTFVAGRNRLENAGAAALADVFQSMGTLEELAMPQNGIYHSGIAALSEAFKLNPALTTLNLNDNTIGSKGAATIALALPRLKNLKSVNFGDCLLKSKGAKALAKAFRENSLSIESLDLSHNEIGRSACMEVVDSLTASPAGCDRLTRVVLAGNSLGDAAFKRSMKEKLGDAAELSDGEGSDNEYETDDSEESEHESEAESESSAEADCSHPTVTDLDIILDTTCVEEVETDVSRFLKEPTADNLLRLGPKPAEVIDTYLQVMQDSDEYIQAYAEAALQVSGAGGGGALYAALCARAAPRHAAQWRLADCLLRGLALLKSEEKQTRIRWPLAPCYSALADVIQQPYFPHALRDTLKFFIASKLASLPADVQAVIESHPTLRT